ncbi:HlyD family efflux transporter periplasmic adaptor subunit [Xanthomonas sp. WHRI 1810A]|uniref:HlyD family efflux transporter periplasmic adaptor subunit n=1 Tax=Xanthomonas sp. WHRI 1810A TaxID=3161565 RepID=UPI0032E8F458
MPISGERTKTEDSVSFLFRDECLNGRYPNTSGRTARHRRSIAVKPAASIATLIVLAILSFGYFGAYTRKVTVKGVLAPQLGTSHSISPTYAIVDEIYVKEGELVTVGQRILKLSKESNTSRGSTYALTAQRIEGQIRLVETRKNLTKLKYKQDVLELTKLANQLNTRIKIFENEILLLAQIVEIKKRIVNKYNMLMPGGAISVVTQEDAKKDLLLASIELQKSRQILQDTIADIENIPLKQQVIGTAAALADSTMNNELLMLSKELLENANSEAVFIVSPIAGTITAINTNIGSAVLPGNTLATTYPNSSKLQANLYTPPEGRGFIENSQRAQIRISAFPFQKYGMVKGTIISISDTPYQSSEMPIQLAEIIDPNRNYYKTVVELEDEIIRGNGKQQALKAGMVVEADLILEKRKIYEWLLEPLYSFTKKHM